MSFKFNFNTETEDERNKPVDVSAQSDTHMEQSKPFAELQPKLEKSLDSYTPEAYPLGDCTIYYVSEKKVESDLKEESSDEITAVLQNNSDLAPNVYEGGLKIWECSSDLIEFFADQEIDFKGKQVLELGCGAGLPSLYAVKNGAEAVHFSDYNDAVLKNVTIPNAHLNCQEDESCSLEKCQFFAGDWSHLQEELCKRGNKYDIIITSETIYSVDSYDKLHNVMSALLNDTGVIYLAAKTFYFGVGGGLQSFEELIKKKNVLEFEVCRRFDESVPREILKLKKKATG